MSFSEKLRDLRLKLDLTQEEVAEAIGVSRNYVSMLESGRSKPSRSVKLLVESLSSSEGSIVVREESEPKVKDSELLKACRLIDRMGSDEDKAALWSIAKVLRERVVSELGEE